jgi:nucleoid-associated protein YgaU
VNAEQRRALGLGGLALIGLGAMLYFEQGPATPAPKPTPTPTPTPVPVPVPTPAPTGRMYEVLGGDTLWAIAQKFYGNPYLYPQIYSANSALIEATAIAHGFASSGSGHWIFPGEMLVIP